jgi:hypothetical protein
VTTDEYLREVAYALRDLPWGQRRDLVRELREHLAELPPGADLSERLGSPERYAADMRAAAGLEHRRGPISYLRARRPRNLVLTALAFTVIGLAIGTLAWVHSYQPLIDGGFGMDPPRSHGVVGSSELDVRFREGKPFGFGFSISNNGRFTVRVLGSPHLPLPAAVHLFTSGHVRYGGFEPPDRRFRPFDLRPGQTASFELRGPFHARCKPAPRSHEFAWIGFFAVRFSFLWGTKTVQIPLRNGISILFPQGMDCLF